MTYLEEIHESRKARLQRIAAKAWKPPVKVEPVIVESPPPRDSVADLLDILSKAPPIFPANSYSSVRKIQRIVAAYYNLSMNDMLSERRQNSIVRPRQRAMYLCKHFTPLSYPEIGRRFGGRDHTTVLHGVRKIAALMESDPDFAVEIEELKQLIGQAHETTPTA